MSESVKTGIIKHQGVVRSNENNRVSVTIFPVSACSGCHAEGSCMISGKEEKLIEVYGRYDVIPGDQVTVTMEQSMGFTALAFGYVLPVLMVVAALVVLISLKVSELVSGLGSIGILMLYYLGLYLIRGSINEKFTFKIKA